MKQTKIDWCDCTLNPVVGCENKCEYCYARKLNDRFNFIKNWDCPQFFPERLSELKQTSRTKRKNIFMNSMSDIMWWEDEWVSEVINAIKKCPVHNYIFLTKDKHLPYDMFFEDAISHFGGTEQYVFFGKTVTNKMLFTDVYNFDFLSIEPLLQDIELYEPRTEKYKLKNIIIGAETGNRENKVIPKKEWVDKIVKWAKDHNIKVFMKESLRDIMGTDFIQEKLLWQGERPIYEDENIL